MVITIVLLFTKNIFGIILACILGYGLQVLESPNLWDYLVDPFLALTSGVV
jgi:hypothetical protein